MTPVEAARASQATIDELWDFDDVEASEARLRTAAGEQPAGQLHDVLLTQVARALGLQHRFAEAREVLAAVDRGELEVGVRAALEEGRLVNSGGDPAAARPHFETGFEAAQAAGFEHLAIDALHMIAVVAPTDEQAALYARALALAAAADDPRAREWRASLLNNAGWARFDGGDLPAALAMFNEALALRIATGQPRQVGIARWCVGRTLRELGRTGEALAIQRELREENVRAGVEDSYVDEEIEACEKALAASSQTSSSPEPGRSLPESNASSSTAGRVA